VLGLLLSGLLLSQAFTGRQASPTPAVPDHRAASAAGVSALPFSARGPLSGALETSVSAYRVVAARDSAGGLQAANPAQRLKESFSASGVTVSSDKMRLGLNLRAAGYGNSLRPVGRAVPRAEGNRVTYAHRGIVEWYRNGPAGLEQGFTIARGPAHRVSGPLTLSLAVMTHAHLSLASNGRGLTVHGARGSSLRYSGLAATDARGHSVKSWLQLDGHRLLLRVDTRHAVYPVIVDPFVSFVKLQGPFMGTGMSYAESVAMSQDASVILAAGPQAGGGGEGHAWFFEKNNGKYEETARVDGQGQYDGTSAPFFGTSAALSKDGNIALVGAPGNNNEEGAVWVFEKIAKGDWAYQTKIKGGTPGAGFGVDVALDATGTTALIFSQQQGNPNVATFSIWEREPGSSKWEELKQKFTGAYPGGALSADGNTAMLGNGGEALERVAPKEPYTEQFVGSNGGPTAALSGDGNIALFGTIGATRDEPRLFSRANGHWSRQWSFEAPLEMEEPEYFGFGFDEFWTGDEHTVALSSDGTIAAIGNPRDGIFYAYTQRGSGWEQLGAPLGGVLIPGQPSLLFEEREAISGDGTTLLLTGGGCQEPVSRIGCESGLYVYTKPPQPKAITEAASEETQGSAVLHATVNPEGTNAQCEFEWGTTTSYGHVTSCGAGLGSGTGGVSVSVKVNPLSANTLYHYRVVGCNEGGCGNGADKTFETLPYQQVSSQPGVVTLENEPGTLAQNLTVNPASPSSICQTGSSNAVVGELSYELFDVPFGGTTTVKLVLPVVATSICKLDRATGKFVELNSTTASKAQTSDGKTWTLTLTDGNEFDQEPGPPNGKIVDPVVPIYSNPCSSLTIETTSLPDATRGTPYNTQLAACSGIPPYKWKKVGKLPKGLKLGKTGAITGTPSTKLAPGSYPVGVSVSDSKKKGKDSATTTLTLKVN
jgi:hypothetical protein